MVQLHPGTHRRNSRRQRKSVRYFQDISVLYKFIDMEKSHEVYRQ